MNGFQECRRKKAPGGLYLGVDATNQPKECTEYWCQVNVSMTSNCRVRRQRQGEGNVLELTGLRPRSLPCAAPEHRRTATEKMRRDKCSPSLVRLLIEFGALPVGVKVPQRFTLLASDPLHEEGSPGGFITHP